MAMKPTTARGVRPPGPPRRTLRPAESGGRGGGGGLRGFRLPRPQFQFWKDIGSELRKVTWPTAAQTRELTLVVLVISTVIGVALGGIDFAFSKLMEVLLFNPTPV